MSAAVASKDAKAHTWPVVLDLGAASGSGSSSRSSTSGSDLVSIRLNFKPPTAPLARDTAGVLHVPNASASTAPWVMEVTHASDEQQGKAFVYSGEQIDAKESDCVLIWDEAKQAYVLSQLGTSFSLRHDRPRTTLSPAASRIMANPPPLPPALRPKRQSTASTSTTAATVSASTAPAVTSASVDTVERPLASSSSRRASKSQTKRGVAAREAAAAAAAAAEAEAAKAETQTLQDVASTSKRRVSSSLQAEAMEVDEPPTALHGGAGRASKESAIAVSVAQEEQRDERMQEALSPAPAITAESPVTHGLGLRTSHSHSPAPRTASTPLLSHTAAGGAGTAWKPPPRPREAAEVVFDDEEEESEEDEEEGEEEEIDDADLEDFAAELEAQFE